jgi:hypothetical protein
MNTDHTKQEQESFTRLVKQPAPDHTSSMAFIFSVQMAERRQDRSGECKDLYGAE